MAESPDPRTFTRIALERGAVVLIEHRASFTAEITNLSMSGMLLKTQEHLEPGTECRISIPLAADGELRIEALATIVRTCPGGFAIQFSTLMGIESYGHLRSLLLYNASQPEELEAEFKSHSGIH